jgi:predicted DCC family thiol-disulfide oxidoreductase YuxK
MLVKSDAALALASYAGGWLRLVSRVVTVVPRPIRDLVYDIVAKHRHELGQNAACKLPDESDRSRFLAD